MSALGAAAALRLRAGEPSYLKTTVSKIIEHVELGRNTLPITCARAALRQWLIDPAAKTTCLPGRKQNDAVNLNIPFTLKRRSVEAKFVLDNDRNSQLPKPDKALIKAVARAYVWNQKLIRGEVNWHQTH